MADELEFDMSEFSRQFRQYMLYSGRSMEEEFRRQVKALLTTVTDITPPAHGKGTRGRSRKMGASKIAADLVGGAGRRAGIFTVLSDGIINSAIDSGAYGSGDGVRLWVRNDGTVYGTQKQFFRPDATLGEMREHHKQHFRNGSMNSPGGFNREEGRWKWIDQMVVRESTFKRYLTTQQRKVGFYAAGFRPGLQQMGMTLPAYMKKHVAKGSFNIDMSGDNFSMVASNKVGYGRIDSELRRKIQWAVNVQAAKMERQLPFLIRKHERLVN